MYTINVLIITYNQEDVISRALDSVLCQKDYGLNKIIICDDCSTDNNVEVIKRIADKYQPIIELYENETNLGIYGNVNKIMELKGSADLYMFLSGDDALCDGFFKTIQGFINNKNVILDNKAVALYSDWKMIDPEGAEQVYKNDRIKKVNNNIIDYRLRGLIYERSVMLSKKLIQQFKPVDISRGVPYAEMMQDGQTARYVEEVYYVPYVASIYYSGVGFSTKTYNKKYMEQYLFAHKALLDNQRWSSNNENYIKALIAKDNAIINHSLRSLNSYIYYYLRSGSFKMGCSVRDFCRRVCTIFIKNIVMRKY